MDVQLYYYINGSWKEYNPKPAAHTHTISDLPNNLLTTNTTQTITGKKTITTNDLNMDGSSVAYIRPNTTSGWARGFWWKTRSTDTPADTRIGGIGVLGSNQSVSYFYIGYGSSPWTNPAVEVRSDYTNIRNGLKLNGEDVATITYLNNALSPYYNQTQVDNLLSGYSIKSHTHSGVYEPVFTKNTAFNKNFGTGNGDVARGDHTHNDYPMKLIRDRGATTNLTNTGTGIGNVATTMTLDRTKTLMIEVAFNTGSYTYNSKIVSVSLGYNTTAPNTSTEHYLVSVPIWNGSDLTIYSFSLSYSGSTLYFGNKRYIKGNFSGTTISWTTNQGYSLYVGKVWCV